MPPAPGLRAAHRRRRRRRSATRPTSGRGRRAHGKQVDALPDDVSVTSIVVAGQPAKVILERLREGRHDLLVMGTRGLGRVGSALLGSVSQAVLHAAEVPVLVVRAPRRLAAAHRPQPAARDAQQRQAVAAPGALAVASRALRRPATARAAPTSAPS